MFAAMLAVQRSFSVINPSMFMAVTDPRLVKCDSANIAPHKIT
jgi:hypothetical protein